MFTNQTYLLKTAQALRNNEISPEQYIEDICGIIEKNEPHIKALVHENNRYQRLLKDVRQLKEQYPDPKKRPLLFGIPVGIKDIIHTEGFDTKAGSNLPPEILNGEEATLVKRLKNAGALILGKTVTTEFAYFEPGETRNPHNTEHTPGGSSSGSAAAVSCGFTPLAVGTQTIGSIIRPAAYCGIIGFKPSFGRIPIDGVIPFSVSADHIGIFTQDIEGIELAASVLCNDWQSDFKINKKPVIGAVSGKYLEQADPEIIEFFEKTLDNLQNKGFIIKRINPFPDIEDINIKHQKMNAFEFSKVHKNWFSDNEGLYRPKTKELILKGKNLRKEDIKPAKKGRKDLRMEVEKIMEINGIDIWLSPSTTGTAPKGMQTGSPLMNLPWTYAGLPALTFPAGKSKDNLPIGLQLAGSFLKDEELLAYALFIHKALL